MLMRVSQNPAPSIRRSLRVDKKVDGA
jgi:hypothetical protein